MNLLAHAMLSEPDPDFRLGNLLADFVKGKDREGLSPNFLRGTVLHQSIDGFTDSHAVTLRSRARVGPGLRRFSGILTDIFYDHFLAREWERYNPHSLHEFTTEFYASVADHPIVLPDRVPGFLQHMIQEDSLGSYTEIAGVATALRRVSTRLSNRVGRPFALEPGVDDLLANYDDIGRDFAEFFPALQMRVQQLTELSQANR